MLSMCVLAVIDLSKLLWSEQAILFLLSTSPYIQMHVLVYLLLLEAAFMFMNGTGDQKNELEFS